MAAARENIAALVGEQKKLRKEKVYGAWGQRVGEEEAEGWGREKPKEQTTNPGCPSLYISVYVKLLISKMRAAVLMPKRGRWRQLN